MQVELSPEQPPEVAEAIAAVVLPPPLQPDPWWQAGIDDALEP